MTTNKRLWTAVLVLSIGVTAYSGADMVLYSDDFSTDKALADSYEHSPICIGFSYYCYRLLFAPCDGFAPHGAALRFSPAGHANPLPFIRYRFTLDAPLTDTTSASVVTTICGPEVIDGWLYVSLSGEALNESEPDTMRMWGTYTTTRRLYPGCQDIYVSFVGYRVDVDEWSLAIASATPVAVPSWGRIKCLYR